jgi:hypothetical protein
VYIDSGINLKLPSGTDPDTPEGSKVLSELATQIFIDMLLKKQIDFTHEPLDGDNNE